jgi:DNA-binding PadR family transcriptional regulator
MSIRDGLLALLSGEPKYGYQLKSEFEEHTGGVWPLNVGQVYTTLDRLQRDELITPGTADGEGRTSYAITKAGRKELNAWFSSAHESAPPRDELMIKVLLSIVTAGVDPHDVIDAQRAGLMTVLRGHRRKLQQAETTRTSHATTHPADADADLQAEHLTSVLLFDALVARVEAELRWLDVCDQRLRSVPISSTLSHPKGPKA